jgi:hypothetical protein
MARNPEDDWKDEVQLALRRENWTNAGPRRLIKVVKPGTVLTEARGYIMVGFSIVGLTPKEIAEAGGLPPNDYALGARIYKLARKPAESEVEYDLTAKFPGGLTYVEGMNDPDYQPGDAALHQWRIREGFSVRVLPDPLDLTPGQRIPYTWL